MSYEERLMTIYAMPDILSNYISAMRHNYRNIFDLHTRFIKT